MRAAFDPADWRGLVVICGGMDWDGPAMSHKQMALQLSTSMPVLFVDPPRSIVRAARDPRLRASLRQPRLQQVGPRLARLTPVTTPGVSRPGLRAAARTATRIAMRRAARRLGGDVRAVVVGSFDRLFDACGERVRIFYGTDDFAAGGELMELSEKWLRDQERAQLARSDRIVAVSEPLAERWRAMGYPVTFIPNGCDAEHYRDVAAAPLPGDVHLAPPIAGVTGHLNERIDCDYLEAVADTGHSLLLVGPRHSTFCAERIDALIARPNVQWVGPKPSGQMASYLKTMTVGLTPYADSPFNRASFPLKTLEYLAAGLPVVSTDLPASRWLNTDLIRITNDPASFTAAVSDALTDPSDDAAVADRQAFAATHSWRSRADDFLPLLGAGRAVSTQTLHVPRCRDEPLQ